MEPFELDSMMVIQAQRQRLIALIDENVQLTAAVNQLQARLAMVPTDEPLSAVEDVTDQVVGAEIGS